MIANDQILETGIDKLVNLVKSCGKISVAEAAKELEVNQKVIMEWASLLEEKDLKLTSQRRTILRQAMGADGHFSAEKLLELSKKTDDTISKATVYRTLALLKESKILEEQDFGDGRKVYERAEGRKHHDHLICTSCGRIVEFHNPTIEELQARVAKQHGYVVTHHKMELYGLCPDCRRK